MPNVRYDYGNVSMNIAAAVSLMSVGGGFVFVLVWLRMSRAPGWESLTSLAAIAATASLFCLGDLFQVIDVSDQLTRFGFQLSIASGSLHGAVWLTWCTATQQRTVSRFERALIYLGVALALLSAMPGVIVGNDVSSFDVPWLGVTYRTSHVTSFGLIAYAYFCVTIGLVSWLTYRHLRPPRGRWLLGAMALLAFAGIHDALARSEIITSPLLVDLSLLVVMVGVGLMELQRFIGDAQRLIVLSTELETQVTQRTEELSGMQATLARSEKLAALGQFAAGVAHEVNNPAAIVSSNLEFAFTTLESEQLLSEEVKSSLTDSMQATKRIARIVRQLLDAGRGAGGDYAAVLPCDPGLAIGRAVARLRQSFGKDFAVDVTIGENTRARADIAIVEQVLFNLFQNAVHAVAPRGRDGCIRVSTRNDGQSVIVEVRDNGSGIPEEVQHHLFEPFFTTKDFGQGTGLGLAVSLGLMRAQHGDLKLVESGPAGSAFALSLVWHNDQDSSLHLALAPTTLRKFRILVVDDDRQLRDSLRRTMSKSFQVELAAGVEEALQCVRNSKDTIDAILCDVLMPSGGGAKLYEDLCRVDPRLARRTLFMTGGATSSDAQRFLQTHSDRVLLKPLDQAKLHEAILALISAATSIEQATDNSPTV